MTDEMPELEWPERMYLLHPSVKTFGEMITNPERKEYICADRLMVPLNERAHLLHTLSEVLDAAEVGEFQTVEIYASDARRLFKILDSLRVTEDKK